MSRGLRPFGSTSPLLDAAALERLALRYVERYATTRARLARYLERKLRERGWAEEAPPDTHRLAARMAELGYVDDRAFAEARAGAMTRRGLGARRIVDALRHFGIDAEDSATLAPEIAAQAGEAALTFARRRRIGPYATAIADRPKRERQIAAMIRAGHAPTLARRIAAMAPGDCVNSLLDRD